MTMRRSSSITAVMAALAIGVVAAQPGSDHTPAGAALLEPAAAAAGGGNAGRQALALYLPNLGCDATVFVVQPGRPNGPLFRPGRPHGPRLQPCPRGGNAGAGFVSPCTPARQSPRALREFGASCFARAP